MILHVFNNQLKFSKGYFQFLYDYGFELNEMKLIHYGKKDKFFSNELHMQNDFIRSYFSIIGNIKLLKDMFSAKKIIIHSLASPALIFYLTLFPQLQEKSVWIIWGKDLHFYHLIKNKRFYHNVYEWFRIRSIRNIGTIVTSIREDYDILNKYYTVTGKYIECNVLYYYSFNHVLGDIKYSTGEKNVLLGNSGSESNNHINALKLLYNNKSEIKKLYCPLSYGGSKKYQQAVINCGKKLFGDKFIPLIDFIPLSEYQKILTQIDIGIFNHNRQEGLANIWSLMFLGKTIYLKESNASAKHFQRADIRIKYIEEISQAGLECFEVEILKKNQNLLKKMMSAENSVYAWRKIMDLEENEKCK